MQNVLFGLVHKVYQTLFGFLVILVIFQFRLG